MLFSLCDIHGFVFHFKNGHRFVCFMHREVESDLAFLSNPSNSPPKFQYTNIERAALQRAGVDTRSALLYSEPHKTHKIISKTLAVHHVCQTPSKCDVPRDRPVVLKDWHCRTQHLARESAEWEPQLQTSRPRQETTGSVPLIGGPIRVLLISEGAGVDSHFFLQKAQQIFNVFLFDSLSSKGS